MIITIISFVMLGLLLLHLSYNVSACRLKAKTDPGEGNRSKLLLAMRARGKLSEYGPTGLTIIFLMEIVNANKIFVAVLAIFFVLGRYMHGLTFGKVSGKNPFLIVGTLFTWLVIVVGCTWLMMFVGSAIGLVM